MENGAVGALWEVLHRTTDGRFVYVVCEGPEPDGPYRPVNGGDGTVRVEYVDDQDEPIGYGWEYPHELEPLEAGP